MFTTVWNFFLWITIGLLILIQILLMDTWALIRILAMHNGCKENKVMNEQKAECAISGKELEEPISKEVEIEQERNKIVAILNDVREVVFQAYAERAKKAKGEQGEDKKVSYLTANANKILEDDVDAGHDF